MPRKFSQATIDAKVFMRITRRNRKKSMIEGAKLLGVAVKKLEDIEAVRGYGCNLSFEVISRIASSPTS